MRGKELKINALPSPQLPQMSEQHVISTYQTEVGNGVFIIVTEYTDPKTGDYIEVFWDNQIVKEVLVGSPVLASFPMTIVVVDDIAKGTHSCYYTAKDISGNTNQSDTIDLTIGDSTPPAIIYPAPIFANAVSDIITQESLTENSGTNIYVTPYKGIIAGDTVKLFFNGYDASGTNVSADVLTDAVTVVQVINGITFLIPEEKFTALDKGTVSAYYEVWRTGVNTGISEGSMASVDLSGGNVSGLSMCISTGAANTDYPSINVYPFNQGVVKGSPGAGVMLSTNGASAVFKESGSALYSVTLNEDGVASFRILSGTQGGVSVNAYETSHPDVSVGKYVTFGPYVKGEGNIKYLNYTTGAPADGLTPCSVYLKTALTSLDRLNKLITKVRVRISSKSGSAEIVGYEGSNTADILLNSDQSVEININNSVAESVTVELSLPESSGSVNRLYVVFVSI